MRRPPWSGSWARRPFLPLPAPRPATHSRPIATPFPRNASRVASLQGAMTMLDWLSQAFIAKYPLADAGPITRCSVPMSGVELASRLPLLGGVLYLPAPPSAQQDLPVSTGWLVARRELAPLFETRELVGACMIGADGPREWIDCMDAQARARACTCCRIPTISPGTPCSPRAGCYRRRRCIRSEWCVGRPAPRSSIFAMVGWVRCKSLRPHHSRRCRRWGGVSRATSPAPRPSSSGRCWAEPGADACPSVRPSVRGQPSGPDRVR